MTKLIGISLSQCVMDIMNGRVQLEDVAMVKTSTLLDSSESWERMIFTYRRYYWSADPDKGEAIARELKASDRIDQPRLRGADAFHVADRYRRRWYTLAEFLAVE